MSKREYSPEAGKSLPIDLRLESYAPFFDLNLAHTLEDLVRPNAALTRVVLDLGVAWRGASNTHHLPALLMRLLNVVGNTPNPYVDFKAILLEKMKDTLKSVRAMARSKILADIGAVCDQFVESWSALPPFSADDYWVKFRDNPEIRYAIWASQRMCYGQVYYAYEDFIVQVFRLLSRQPDYRFLGTKTFARDLAVQLGAELANVCWSAPEVKVARLTRHALVHCGGRLTEELKSENHGFQVVQGEIQIFPVNTKSVHDVLKPRVLEVAKAAIAKLGSHSDGR